MCIGVVFFLVLVYLRLRKPKDVMKKDEDEEDSDEGHDKRNERSRSSSPPPYFPKEEDTKEVQNKKIPPLEIF